MSDEQNSKMQQLAEKFSTALGSIDQEAERNFINELIETVTLPAKKIPEPVFREIFLPYFSGEKIPTKDNDALAHWIGLVGSATDAADVVDVKGEVLFRVPALYDTECLNPANTANSGMNFGTIFEIYQDQARVHPNLGKTFLVEELVKKTSATINQEQLVKSNGWDPVLRHYHLLPEQKLAEDKKKATPGDDDLIFGDD